MYKMNQVIDVSQDDHYVHNFEIVMVDGTLLKAQTREDLEASIARWRQDTLDEASQRG